MRDANRCGNSRLSLSDQKTEQSVYLEWIGHAVDENEPTGPKN